MNAIIDAPTPESHETLFYDVILGDDQFVEANFQGARRGAAVPWQRVTVRPVLIKEARHLQFVYFDGVQTITRNYRDKDVEVPLRELLDLPYKNIGLTTTGEAVRVQFSKKDRPIVHRDRRRSEPISLNLTHDRPKQVILSEDDPAPFLQAIGVTTTDGRVRADRQRKFRQINEFLRLIEETGEIDQLEGRPIRVVDLGCGSAALTFATYHYLNNIKGIPTTMTGVDTKAYLLDRHRETAERLGWPGMTFEAGRIVEFQTADAPDIVLALHACDTATDEALARAVRWRSKLIFSAPCCHHHLQAQLTAAETPEPFRPVLRHGILRERLGDILTDSFRALILRLMGYRADALQFIDADHTPKNLMIRAVYADAPVPAALVTEYRALKSFWSVTPYLEELLRDELHPILAAS